MHSYYQNITVYGQVTVVNMRKQSFTLKTRSEDEFLIGVDRGTSFSVLTNIDSLDRDRLAAPEDIPGKQGEGTSQWNLAKFVKEGSYLTVSGVYSEDGTAKCFQARSVIVPYCGHQDEYVFERTHWWIDQVSLMADRWLDELFDSTRSYTIDDFSKLYRTNLNITGHRTDDKIQECATLSRLIYGLSSAYLMTGSERYLMAASAGVQYQRQSYRSLTHDGKYCFWAFGRRITEDGVKLVIPSENEDDKGAIPLYEQIYALAGLAQYYRITQDSAVLEDILRTIKAFQDFYHDDESAREKGFPGHGGYFSHLDYATMRPDTPGLGDNMLRKNWNSIGDHIPAYLINVLLSVDPVPKRNDNAKMLEFRDVCRSMLEETTRLIIDKFPDRSGKSNYVNERFKADFTPDHSWKWQENRGIVGHNLKIAWNLTRVGFYFQTLARAEHRDKEKYETLAAECLNLAKDIGEKMSVHGLDMVRGGVFDAVERCPSNGMPVEFTWSCTKDFWQQEQGILAYLILHGADPEGKDDWLGLARECMMFWNCFFSDRDRQGIYFRTTEDGLPIIYGMYGKKGGHSVSCYHAFELNYLAHLYIRAYVVNSAQRGEDADFCLYYRVSANCGQDSINVVPDFFPPGKVRIEKITVNGIDRTADLKPNSTDDYQVRLESSMFDVEMAVQFAST